MVQSFGLRALALGLPWDDTHRNREAYKQLIKDPLHWISHG